MKNHPKDAVPVQALLMPRYLIWVGKILQLISPKLASRFAARLFLTPFKFPRPKREQLMFENAKIESLVVPAINREIIVYHFGDSKEKILLCHGWSGSGTQLSKIAEDIVSRGYSTISFDAPAHGDASGKISMMPFFIEAIKFLHQTYPFHSAIGHSLGGMSLLKCVSDGLPLKRICIIGTANSVTHITKDFVKNLQLKPKIAIYLKNYLDGKFQQDLNTYSGATSAQGVTIPTLVIHDKNDVDVHYSSSEEIDSALENGKLLLTEGLGHRRILGDPNVIKHISEFVLV